MAQAISQMQDQRHTRGCMVCGEPLEYGVTPRDVSCSFCGTQLATKVACAQGHFVCDACHLKDGVQVIKHVCLSTKETDMIRLMKHIRTHPAIPLHGPDHHAMVPGIILSTYRNLGGEIAEEEILSGIARGARVPGGDCGYIGVCGAVQGVGIAYGILLQSSPLKPDTRQAMHRITGAVIQEIAKNEAARCCQRDCWIALRTAARLSKEYLPIALQAGEELVCKQARLNKECAAAACAVIQQAKKRRART